MSDYGLTKENLLRSLPVSLSGDPKMLALAEAVADLLSRRGEEIDRVSIYPHIDRLDEELLDILARDFKVDWWDNDYSLEEKRRTLASSWQVHKALGTKAAVEQAISAIYPGTKVAEWFDYGGKPYHFKLAIHIADDDINSQKQRRVLDRLAYYKNLRSHLDEIRYLVRASPTPAYAGAALASASQLVSVGLEPDAHWPRTKLSRTAGAVTLIQRATHQVALTAPEVKWPQSRITPKFGVAVLGVYQEILV